MSVGDFFVLSMVLVTAIVGVVLAVRMRASAREGAAVMRVVAEGCAERAAATTVPVPSVDALTATADVDRAAA